MIRMQLPTTLVIGLLVGACTSSDRPSEVGSSSAALAKVSTAAKVDRADVVVAPIVVVRPPDSIIDRVKPRLPIEVMPVDPDPSTPPVTPDPPACSSRTLWISSKDIGCPSVGETSTGVWKPSQIFKIERDQNPDTDDDDVIGEDLPEALANVCAYDWTPRVDEPPNYAQLRERLSQYHRPYAPEYDCSVMTSLAPDDRVLDGELWRAMRDTAHQQAGRPRGVPSFKTHVFMGVIDSAARKYEEMGLVDTFGHGRLVGRIIQDLNCSPDGGECASVIYNKAALLYDYKGNRNTDYGGYIGTRSDLSVAIHRAVNTYINRLPDEKMMRGIINLSLGWDPMHGGNVDDPSQLTPASYAVWAAMARASCVGMINIAAAGNTHGTSNTGPVLPAAWQNLRAPNWEECRALMYHADTIVKEKNLATSIGDRSVPLCVAVAATDERDNLLSTTRTGSASRHVAYGLSMVTDEIDGARGEHTSILTGSSFAAAVMSAAVAGAWAVDPAMTPRDVIELVYKASEELGSPGAPRPATLPYAGSIDEQRRVSVCNAIQYAGCNHGCDPNLACERISAGTGKALWTPELFERAADATLSSVAISSVSEPSALAQPWTCGQPVTDGCNRCSLFNLSRKVTIGLSVPAATATKDIYVIAGGQIYYIPPPIPGGAYPESMASYLPPAPAVQQATVFRNLQGGAALYEAISVLEN